MPSITRSTARPTSTTAERPTDTPRTAWRNTDGAADAGRPRVPEAAKAAGRESCSGRSDGGSGVGGASAAPLTGLLYVPKVSATPPSRGVDAELSAADALGLRFPTPDLVASAVALFEPAHPWAHGRDILDREGLVDHRKVGRLVA